MWYLKYSSIQNLKAYYNNLSFQLPYYPFHKYSYVRYSKKINLCCSKWDSLWDDYAYICLTHWGWVTHICVSKLTIIGSDNGLVASWRQAIIWTIGGILLMWTLGTDFSKILSKIYTLSFKKISLENVVWKIAAFCLGLNVLTYFFTKITNVTYCIIFAMSHTDRADMIDRINLAFIASLKSLCCNHMDAEDQNVGQ